MNYKFPIINTIDDVLPHIKGREEFVVAERDYGIVLNYVVAMPDTFNMTGPNDLGGAMRRECRGLFFDLEGKIISRPFHKFFNVNEREETQAHLLNFMFDHVIMEKMDGSMIRPFIINDEIRLGTKMGLTDVSLQAEKWLYNKGDNVKGWLRSCVENGITPLFEWISQNNQIVLKYEQDDLVYLGSRDNVTGVYTFEHDNPFSKVPQYGSLNGNLDEYITRQRKEEGREGDIIRFSNGHMLKVKNDWYVRIHKVKDKIRFEHHIAELVLKEGLDDIYPSLDADSREYVETFEADFWKAFQQKENRLYGLRIACQQSYEDDRKRIALEFIPTLENKADAQFVFGQMDNKDLRTMMLSFIEKNISTSTKFEDLKAWMDFNPVAKTEFTDLPNIHSSSQGYGL